MGFLATVESENSVLIVHCYVTSRGTMSLTFTRVF